jgi:sulfur carrier protein
MKIMLNDEEYDFTGETLIDLITTLNKPVKGLAVAINRTIVPKHSWPETVITERAEVMIFEIIAGG